MARMREYSTFAERQAAYRKHQQASLPPLYLPALRPLWQVHSTGRWRMAVDLAARLLQSVAEDMQAYSDQRSDQWHDGASAQVFHDNLDRINDVQSLIDDLRSDL